MMAPQARPAPQAADLAIVGGGSVAVSFLYQFLLCLDPAAGPPPAIVLYEPQAEPGPGGAYQDDLSSNLLNIPAGNMSALADHRLDFVEWLRGQDPAWLRAQGEPLVRLSTLDGNAASEAVAERAGFRRERTGTHVDGRPLTVWLLPLGAHE